MAVVTSKSRLFLCELTNYKPSTIMTGPVATFPQPAYNWEKEKIMRMWALIIMLVLGIGFISSGTSLYAQSDMPAATQSPDTVTCSIGDNNLDCTVNRMEARQADYGVYVYTAFLILAVLLLITTYWLVQNWQLGNS